MKFILILAAALIFFGQISQADARVRAVKKGHHRAHSSAPSRPARKTIYDDENYGSHSAYTLKHFRGGALQTEGRIINPNFCSNQKYCYRSPGFNNR